MSNDTAPTCVNTAITWNNVDLTEQEKGLCTSLKQHLRNQQTFCCFPFHTCCMMPKARQNAACVQSKMFLLLIFWQRCQQCHFWMQRKQQQRVLMINQVKQVFCPLLNRKNYQLHTTEFCIVFRWRFWNCRVLDEVLDFCESKQDHYFCGSWFHLVQISEEVQNGPPEVCIFLSVTNIYRNTLSESICQNKPSERGMHSCLCFQNVEIAGWSFHQGVPEHNAFCSNSHQQQLNKCCSRTASGEIESDLLCLSLQFPFPWNLIKIACFTQHLTCHISKETDTSKLWFACRESFRTWTSSMCLTFSALTEMSPDWAYFYKFQPLKSRLRSMTAKVSLKLHIMCFCLGTKPRRMTMWPGWLWEKLCASVKWRVWPKKCCVIPNQRK